MLDDKQAVVRLLCYVVVQEDQPVEVGEVGEGEEVVEVEDVIVLQHQGVQVWDRILEVVGDAEDQVVGHQQSLEPLEERKVLQPRGGWVSAGVWERGEWREERASEGG